MNIINKALVRLVMLPAGIYRRMGADPHLLATILTTKLVINDRTPNTIHQTQRKKSTKPVSMATLGTMVVSAIMGALFLFSFLFGTDATTQLTLYFSMFLVLLSSMLIADFTTILLDVKDNVIILTRPVNNRTFITARLLHILIHLLKLVIPLSLPAFCFIIYRYHIGMAAWFLVVVFFLTLFSIFLINAIYLVAMRMVSPQRFQTVISYVQIVLGILIYASYQVVPRLLGDLSEISYQIGTHWYALLIPPFWFASGWSLLHHSLKSYELVGVLFCFTLPLAGIWLVVRYLAASFVRNLALTNATGEAPTRKKQKAPVPSSFPERLTQWLMLKGEQKAGFLFAWKVSGRSRDFRMKVLPTIGYLVVYVFLVLWKPIRDGNTQFDTMEGPGKFLMLAILYFGVFSLVTALGQMKYSEQHKAAWIFFSTPVPKPGWLIAGAFKAMVVKFYLPIAIPFGVAAIAISGPIIIPNVLLALANQLLLAALLVLVVNRQLPFAVPQQSQEKGNTILRSIMVLSIASILSIFHYFIFSILPAVILCSVLSAGALWMVFNSIKETSWAIIRQTD